MDGFIRKDIRNINDNTPLLMIAYGVERELMGSVVLCTILKSINKKKYVS
jgi:hypothetical protein